MIARKTVKRMISIVSNFYVLDLGIRMLMRLIMFSVGLMLAIR